MNVIALEPTMPLGCCRVDAIEYTVHGQEVPMNRVLARLLPDFSRNSLLFVPHGRQNENLTRQLI